jgi:hypothetical protein
VTSGSTRDHFPPAGPQPMRGTCTEAFSSAARPARRPRAVPIAAWRTGTPLPPVWAITLAPLADGAVASPRTYAISGMTPP